MLNRLMIRQYAIIPSLDVEFGPGLTIITGETGAGKSILLDALGLALGKRADTRVLPDEEAKCIVEAHFDQLPKGMKTLFAEADVDADPELICRREIAANNRSRSFINDSPVPLKTMMQLTAPCIELHHQHDHLALQSTANQIRLLDTVSQSVELYQQYHSIFIGIQKLLQELKALRELEVESQRKKDFLQFQLEELENAKLVPGEMTRLEEQQTLLENSELIEQTIDQLKHTLEGGQGSIHHQLTQLIKQLESGGKAYPPLAELLTRLESMRIEVADLAQEVDRIDSPGATDPKKLIQTQSRLNQLYSLLKKYHCRDEEELARLHQELKAEFNEIQSVANNIGKAEKKIEAERNKLSETGQQLSTKRKAGAKKLVPKVESLLKELGMPNARFGVSAQTLKEPGPTGLDEIEFVFSANLGMEPAPLAQVASGGELSRLSLALKSVYAGQAEMPTIIFDEIDTGISGEVAWKMGQLIRGLAKNHQVMMVTHSPQIAAHADTHFHVSKKLDKKRDVSMIQQLSPEQRVVEIAKMLSGDPPAKTALANAQELIRKASGVLSKA